MRKRTNKFNRALKHIKSTKIDDKLSMLEAAPTNSTAGLYSRVTGEISTTVQDPENPTSPDYSTIDFDIDGEDGKDTSGLFDSTGNSLFVAPPGDNSYILGPMAAQYYGWLQSNKGGTTRIGYIRESDRRIVNLGSIYGKITEWDGDPYKFFSFGQLTLEQALWFRDIGKKDGDTSGVGNYRAFYPGPPSGGSDSFGRYLTVIVGIPLATVQNFITKIEKEFADLPIGKEALANFAAMLARLKTGSIKMDNPFTLYEPILDALAKMTGTSAEKDNVDDYMRNFIPDLFAGKNPTGSTPDNPRDNSGIYDDKTISDYEKIFQDWQRETNSSLPNLEVWKTNYDLAQSKNSSIGNTTGTLDPDAGDGFIDNGDGTVTLRKAFDFDRYDDMAGSNLATTLGAMTYGIMSGIPGLLARSGGKTPTMYTGITFDKETGKVIKNYKSPSKSLGDTYKPTGKLLSESRKIEILKNIKKPVVVRETKQKKYKVSPGKRFLEKRAKTNFQGMNKLVGDVKPQKSFKKPDNIWSTGWQKYNAKLSQGKKNIVLEKIGEGKQAWNYMLNNGAAMDAKNLEEFWGKNPDFYSYFFNGKKYRPIRKEQVKGDYIVFLVDEFGANSNMLQSELNAKLAEEDDKKLLVEYEKLYGKFYNKLDPISANSMPPTGDPEIDAKVNKQKTKSKTKLYDRLKVKIKKDLTNK